MCFAFLFPDWPITLSPMLYSGVAHKNEYNSSYVEDKDISASPSSLACHSDHNELMCHVSEEVLKSDLRVVCRCPVTLP